MSHERLSSLGVILYVVSVACTGTPATPPSGNGMDAPPPKNVEVQVIDGAQEFPAKCTPRSIAELAHSFLEARSTGNAEMLEALLAPEGEFKWVSEVTDSGNTAAYRRADAVQYLLDVPRASVLAMIRVKFDPATQIANVGFVLADEPASEPKIGQKRGLFVGKGAIECTRPSIVLWTVGEQERRISTWPCKRPADWRPGEAIVACGRN